MKSTPESSADLRLKDLVGTESFFGRQTLSFTQDGAFTVSTRILEEELNRLAHIVELRQALASQATNIIFSQSTLLNKYEQRKYRRLMHRLSQWEAAVLD